MKRFLIMIGVLLSIQMPLSAAKEDVPMSIAKKGQGNKFTTVKRAPMYVSLEIIYDDTAHVIEVISEEEVDAQVYIKGEDGAILGYSGCLNTTLNVPSGFIGILTISIECDEWTAEGEIEIRK